MIAALLQLLVVTHDHFGVLVAENLRRLGESCSRLQQIGCDGVAIEVGDKITAEVQLLADTAESTSDGVAVPGVAVLVAEKRSLWVLRHQPSGQFYHGGGENDHTGLAGGCLGLVAIQYPDARAQVDMPRRHHRHLAGSATSVLQREQEVAEAVALGVVVEDLLPLLGRKETLP